MTAHWYVIHVYSGFEKKVKESLESRVQAFGLPEKIVKVVIPTEPVTEIRGGKNYTVERMFYPGYVLVQMDLDRSFGNREPFGDAAVPQALSDHPHDLDLSGRQEPCGLARR